MLYWTAKAPGEVEPYVFDFTDQLAAGETLVAPPIITATGVTENGATIAGVIVTVELADGAVGTPGIVTCQVTTSRGNTLADTAIVPIGLEPVTLAMAQAQCRAEGITADDSILLELVQSARELIEKYTGTKLIASAVEMTFGTFGELRRLSQAPVQSITQIQYLDSMGVLRTLDPATYEFIDVAADPLRPRIRPAFGQSWPQVRRCADDAVRVSAVVGYTVVPMPLVRAILLLVGQWYDFRTGAQIDARGVPAEVPNAVSALISNYRR